MTEHLDIKHWSTGDIIVTTESRKWEQMFLHVNEQRELLNYLLLNIEKHEEEERKCNEGWEQKYGNTKNRC
jgi:hypothetical protein